MSAQAHAQSDQQSDQQTGPSSYSRADADLPLWTLLALRGALLLLFGLAALFFPLTTLVSLAVLTGILVLGDGLTSLWRAVRRLAAGKREWLRWAARGGLGVLIGALMLFAPLLATVAYATIILTILAAWAIFTGGIDVAQGLSRDGDISLIWWGTVLVLAGAGLFTLLLWSPAAFLSLAWLLSILALFAAATMLSRALLLRWQVRSRPPAPR